MEDDAQLSAGDSLGWLADRCARAEVVRVDGAFILEAKARKRAKAALIVERALLKRCLAFIEYQVDHYKRDGDRAYVDLDLGEASILLVDLQEVTR